MFVRRAEDKAGAISLWSWDSNASLLSYRVDSYFVAHPKGEVFLYSGEVTHDKEKEGEEAINDISRSLRSREPKEAPTEPGFCIDHAYIAGDSFQDEEFGVGVTFPNHPGARFEFRSSTGSELNSLLERVDGFVQNMLATVAGVERLRKGKHPVGSLPGEEYLVAGSNKGQRAYTFMWEVQGKEESLTEPNLTAGLAVLERSNENGKPPPLPSNRTKRLWNCGTPLSIRSACARRLHRRVAEMPVLPLLRNPLRLAAKRSVMTMSMRNSSLA